MVGLEQGSYQVSEEDGTVRVCATLTQPVSSLVTATISTSDITATGEPHLSQD